MKIEKLNITFAERYESFLLVQEEALIYHSWRYQNFLVELLDCYQETRLVVDREGQILAALPLMSMDDCKYGRVFNSMPYYGSHGSVIGNNAEAVRMLQNEFRDLHRNSKVAASTVIENPLSKNDNNSFDYDLYVERIGQFTRIENLKSDDLMEIFHSKTRNMIRKACKLGITCEVDNKNFAFLSRVHHENMLEVGGLSKSSRSFELIKKHFIEESDYRLYIAKHQGSEVAALLVFYYNSIVEYYTPVISKDYRDTQALSFLIFKAMCDAASRGYKLWNWGGTWITQDGVYRFKSRWGTFDKSYRYFIKISNIALYEASCSEIASRYPNFFVIPFGYLKS